jgi:hypothetical protein
MSIRALNIFSSANNLYWLVTGIDCHMGLGVNVLLDLYRRDSSFLLSNYLLNPDRRSFRSEEKRLTKLQKRGNKPILELASFI